MEKASIFHILSFTNLGYYLHKLSWPTSNKKTSLAGQKGLITGGTSGIGFATATQLSECGASLYLASRNKEKGTHAAESLSNESIKHHFVTLDTGDVDSIEQAITSFSINSLDFIIFSAGSMPFERSESFNGIESIFATHVVGQYYLLSLLIEKNILKKGARIVFVSSGGLYSQKLALNLHTDSNQKYNRYASYGNAKRWQIELVKELSEKHDSYSFGAMHPGWAKTPGVSKYMPIFSALMAPFLRSKEQGADTIVDMILSSQPYRSGGFYFDRKKAPYHLSSSTVSNHPNLISLLDGIITSSKK